MAILTNASPEVTLTNQVTLTNKTLTAPTISDPTFTGTTTNINTTNLVIEDKNIVINDVTSPSDSNADSGGISLNGDTTKTLEWKNATDAWTSSENLDLASTKTYKIAGTDVLTASAVLGKSVPSGTIVGTSDSQTLTGKTIDGASNTLTVRLDNTDVTGTLVATKGGTAQSSYTTGDILYASATNTLSKLAVGTEGQLLTIVSGVPAYTTPAAGTTANDQAFAFAVQVFA